MARWLRLGLGATTSCIWVSPLCCLSSTNKTGVVLCATILNSRDLTVLASSGSVVGRPVSPTSSASCLCIDCPLSCSHPYVCHKRGHIIGWSNLVEFSQEKERGKQHGRKCQWCQIRSGASPTGAFFPEYICFLFLGRWAFYLPFDLQHSNSFPHLSSLFEPLLSGRWG